MPDQIPRVTFTVAPNQAALDLGVKAAQGLSPFLKGLEEFKLEPFQIGGKGRYLGQDVEARLVLEMDNG